MKNIEIYIKAFFCFLFAFTHSIKAQQVFVSQDLDVFSQKSDLFSQHLDFFSQNLDHTSKKDSHNLKSIG